MHRSSRARWTTAGLLMSGVIASMIAGCSQRAGPVVTVAVSLPPTTAPTPNWQMLGNEYVLIATKANRSISVICRGRIG